MRPGDHESFLETHENSVRLGRSAYVSVTLRVSDCLCIFAEPGGMAIDVE